MSGPQIFHTSLEVIENAGSLQDGVRARLRDGVADGFFKPAARLVCADVTLNTGGRPVSKTPLTVVPGSAYSLRDTLRVGGRKNIFVAVGSKCLCPIKTKRGPILAAVIHQNILHLQYQ